MKNAETIAAEEEITERAGEMFEEDMKDLSIHIGWDALLPELKRAYLDMARQEKEKPS